jgi:transposase-like protein
MWRPTRCSRTRGKKGDRHPDPKDPPRGRANKRRGHGTYDNDRPPIIGSVGRRTGEARLRVIKHTDKETLLPHVHGYTPSEATVYTDEWHAYERIARKEASNNGQARHKGVGRSGREMTTGMGSGRFT